MKIKKAVIPAAGLGTRMLPATKAIPKEMLPIIDKTAIQYIVEEAVASGIDDILIIISRGKWPIEDHFDSSFELEEKLKNSGKLHEAEVLRELSELADIQFLRQKEQKGLGHAIWCARRFTGNEPFAVMLGDDIMCGETPVTLQLIRAAEHYGGSAVAVREVSPEEIGRYCSLDVSPVADRVFDVHSLIEKPRPEQVMSLYAILGRYVLTPAIMPILENTPPGFGGEIQLTDGLNVLCKKERMLAVDFEGIRHDTGTPQGYLETIINVGLTHPETGAWLREYLKTLKP